jgi:hypothetical protein
MQLQGDVTLDEETKKRLMFDNEHKELLMKK